MQKAGHPLDVGIAWCGVACCTIARCGGSGARSIGACGRHSLSARGHQGRPRAACREACTLHTASLVVPCVLCVQRLVPAQHSSVCGAITAVCVLLVLQG